MLRSRQPLKAAVQARSKRTQITADRVVTELAKLAFANLGDYLPEELEADPYKDLQRLDRDRRAALEEVQVEHFVQRRGEDARQVRKVKFKLHDKQSALDSLARHLGMFPMSERRSRRPKFSAR
jgi:phage terminase small subunit